MCIRSFCFALMIFIVNQVSVSALQVEEKDRRPFNRPPKLELMFEDEFKQDSRSEFSVKGDIQWKQNTLELGNDAVLLRKLDAGAWIEIKCDFSFKELAPNGKAKIKICIDFDGIRDGCVVFEQKLIGEDVSSRIAIEQASTLLTPKQNEIAELSSIGFDSGLPNEEWTIEYRYGLWTVKNASNEFVLSASTDTKREVVKSVSVEVSRGSTEIKKYRISGTKQRVQDQFQERLREFDKLDDISFNSFNRGNYQEAANAATESKKLRFELLGPYHPDYLKSSHNLAAALHKLDRFEDSEHAFEECMKHSKDVFGPLHSAHLSTLNNMGNLYFSWEKYEKAVEKYLLVYESKKTLSGNASYYNVRVLASIARTYVALKAFDRALPYYVEAANLIEAKHGADHPEFANAMYAVASCYRDAGKVEKSLISFKRAKDALARLQGEKSPSVGRCLHEMALLNQNLGRLKQAEPLLQEVSEIYKQVYGVDHDNHAWSLIYLGRLYCLMEEFEKAEVTLNRSLAIMKTIHGVRHQTYIETLGEIANLYHAKGDYKKASDIYQRQITLWETNFEANNQLISCIHDLGRMNQELRNFSEAEANFKKAVDLESKLNGENSERYARQLCWLAQLYRESRDFSKAESLYLEAKDLYSKTVGQQHSSYKTTVSNLGELYGAMESSDSAIEQYQELVEIERSDQKSNPEGNIDAITRLAIAFEKAKKIEPAELQYRTIAKLTRERHGSTSPEHTLALIDLAKFFQRQQDFGNAERLYKDALALSKQLGTNELYADTASSLSVCYLQTNRSQEAQELLTRVDDLWQQKGLPATREYAFCLTNLGSVHRNNGNRGDAIVYFQRANVILSAYPSDKEYASLLNELGTLYRDHAEYAKAEEALVKCRQVYAEAVGNMHSLYATSCNNLGLLYVLMGQYDKAEPLYLEAKQIRKTLFGQENEEYFTSVNNLGMLYFSKGAFEKARPLLTEVHSKQRKLFGTGNADYARYANNLAMYYDAVGNFKKAESLFLEAIRIRKSVFGENHKAVADSLNNLAMVYFELLNYEKAEELLKRAIEIRKSVLGDNHPLYSQSLNNLAQIYSKRKLYGLALPLMQKVKLIETTTIGKHHPDYARTLNNLGMVYLELGDYSKAKQHIAEAISIYKNSSSKGSRDYAVTVNNFAILCSLDGDFEKAAEYYSKSLELLTNTVGKRSHDYAMCRYNLSGAYRSLGKHEKAAAILFEEISNIKDLSQEYSALQNQQQQLAFGKRVEIYLKRLTECAITDSNLIERVALTTVNTRGLTTLRQQSYRNLAESAGTKANLDELQVISQRLFNHMRDTSDEADWLKRLNELEKRKEALERELSKTSSLVESPQQDVSIAELNECLPPSSAFVVFGKASIKVKNDETYQEQLTAFVFCKQDPNVRLLQLGPMDKVSAAIKEFRSALRHDADSIAVTKGNAAATRLREIVWLPIKNQINSAETVLISPIAEISSIPFAALPGSQPDTYLIEEFKIAYAPIPQLLPSLAKTSEAVERPDGDLLLVGGVDFEGKQQKKKRRRRGSAEALFKTDWQYLKHTLTEVIGIQRLFTEVFEVEPGAIKVLTGKYSTEDAFKTFAGRFEILHVATHGFFADSDPKRFQKFSPNEPIVLLPVETLSLQNIENRAGYMHEYHPGLISGFVLSSANNPPNDGSDDGILTAEEISYLQLSGVDLVTLSACETGIGKSEGSEGLLSLQRSFHVAGARTVIASLWKVDDFETGRLMERFYKNMFEKDMPKLDALVEAQRWMLKNPAKGIRGINKVKGREIDEDDARTPPFYWAAWTLSGDWE